MSEALAVGDAERMAERFRALAEPARLQILHALREGEMTVSRLIEATGLGQANLSKHLQLLHGGGFVARRKEGLFVYYTLADVDTLRLLEAVRD
jgi:DNA-binding transcriptional ArsR family regulator